MNIYQNEQKYIKRSWKKRSVCDFAQCFWSEPPLCNVQQLEMDQTYDPLHTTTLLPFEVPSTV